MVAIRRYVIGWAAVWATLAVGREARAAGPLVLREATRVGSATRVEITLSARGEIRLASASGAASRSNAEDKGKAKELESGPATTFPLKSDVRIEYIERVMKVDPSGRAALVVRRAFRAGSAVNVGTRPTSTSLRGAVAILAAVPVPGGVDVYSPLGPLTRPELDVLETPGDPLTLTGLLPDREVAAGDRWKVGEAAAKALCSYDTITSNTVEARLDSADEERAVVRLSGEARGARLGGDGTIVCEGSFTFDRKTGLIARLTLDRAETRRPGLVEEGLDVKSTLNVTRKPAEAPPELGDATLAKLALGADPARLRLLYQSPDGRYALAHDRDWHLFHEDVRAAVLKRVEGGELVAQCNLAVGPNAGKGRHQDLGQFRQDVKRGLGGRFSQFLGEGEPEGDPGGHFRYKVGVQGRQGDLGLIWYYYLVASPEGDQVVATFTLADTRLKAFGSEDERLMGSFRWTTPAEASR